MSIDLEILRSEHASMTFEGLADARGYIFIPAEPPASVEALEARYEKLVAGCSPDGTERWRNWVIRDRESDTLVGYTQATIRDRLAFIAYQVLPARWRQGLATAALRATLDELFREDPLDEIHALVDTRNAASIALLEELGFLRTRTISDADHFKGSTSHEYELVLHRAQWPPSAIPKLRVSG